MNALLIDGHELALDSEGYLKTLEDWSPSVADALARREGLELQAEHWEVIEALRAFYREFQLSPATRPLVRYMAQRLGPEKGNSAHLNRLFKGTPAKLAAKLAGLPRPTNCL